MKTTTSFWGFIISVIPSFRFFEEYAAAFLERKPNINSEKHIKLKAPQMLPEIRYSPAPLIDNILF